MVSASVTQEKSLSETSEMKQKTETVTVFLGSQNASCAGWQAGMLLQLQQLLYRVTLIAAKRKLSLFCLFLAG